MNWAGTLLGCVAIVLIPIPVIFYRYGAKIRAKSAFAPTFPMPSAAPIADEEMAVSASEEEKTSPRGTNGDNVVQ